jgi:hypothetical protein
MFQNLHCWYGDYRVMGMLTLSKTQLAKCVRSFPKNNDLGS